MLARTVPRAFLASTAPRRFLAPTAPRRFLTPTPPLLRRPSGHGTEALLGGKAAQPHWRQSFGNIRQVPRGYQYPVSIYRTKIFRMKKHRYTKRWRMNRYKLAALANMPFNRKIRLHMLPKLTSTSPATGKAGRGGDLDIDGLTKVTEVAAKLSGNDAGKKNVYRAQRPPSKYM